MFSTQSDNCIPICHDIFDIMSLYAAEFERKTGIRDKGLTLYHTIPTFYNPKEEGFIKHCGKRRKCW